MSEFLSHENMPQAHPKKLNEFFSTAICGNDILSSALYVSGIAILFAGVYAPLILLAIGGVLFLYKSVYIEVVEALPVNGGAYNCLLNGTQKILAALAGITTFLSYIATAVISAKVAVEYLHTIVPVPVIFGTIALLFAFALLVIIGIKDSARVAGGIFILHVVSLSIFLLVALAFYLTGHSFFGANLAYTHSLIENKGGLLTALFLAFSASLLGVSGFESSANFVEEQEPGVFRKTLRNMLIGVAFFNPLIALAVLNTLPFEVIVGAKDFLLSDAAFSLGGNFFRIFVVIDAFLVLSGAVLTSYVGVSGLIYRMAADSCLPNFLTKRNNRGSYSRIVLTFFVLCSSILLITKGDLLSLAGVYTIAFLGVMSLFALGNLILKGNRRELKRTYHAPTLYVILAFVATFVGIMGNMKIDPQNVVYFGWYFVPAVFIVFVVVYEDGVLQVALKLTKPLPIIHNYLEKHFKDISEGRFVIFVHHVSRLYAVLNYVSKNEIGRKVYIVHCLAKNIKLTKAGCKELEDAVRHMQKAGVLTEMEIEVVCRHEAFGPKMIQEISKEFNIRENRMMIGSIHTEHPYDYEELQGVRIIF